MARDFLFPRYTAHDPKVPVWCVTPNGGAIHRFFDTTPFSPTGRYLALFRMPFEDRMPKPGDAGHVLIVDLHEGTERVVAETRGWEPQMGANINWGADDRTLFFNDVDPKDWIPFAVKLDPVSGTTTRMQGTVYHASPDGTTLASSCMRRMRRTQSGYGVVVPDESVPRNIGPRDDDGLYFTDTNTGRSRLVLSIREAIGRMNPPPPERDLNAYEFYGFHAKWNPQGSRLVWTMRWAKIDPDGGWNLMGKGLKFNVFTLKPDGTDIHDAIPWPEWDKGPGHHNNWFPDGEHLSMNLSIDGKKGGLWLCRTRYDGSGLRKITDRVKGSGHPTVHPDGKHILTDAYAGEGFGLETTPLRWINIEKGTEEEIVRFPTYPEYQKTNGTLRLDPHPAWDRTHRLVAFNAFMDGRKRVMVADLSELLSD